MEKDFKTIDEQLQILRDAGLNERELYYFLIKSGASKDLLQRAIGKTKTINIRKIRRKFRDKSFDYIIANFEELKPYLRSFIKNSIYLNRGKIYYFNIKEFELEELENRYVRYNSEVEIKKNLVIIDNSNSKTNMLKNIFYYFCDLIYDVIDLIGRMLVN